MMLFSFDRGNYRSLLAPYVSSPRSRGDLPPWGRRSAKTVDTVLTSFLHDGVEAEEGT